MATFFGLLAMLLTVGLGAACIFVIKQKSQIDHLRESVQTAGEDLASCRASFAELKAKAEAQIRGLMQKLQEEGAKAAGLGQSLAYQLERIKRWQAIIDAEAEAAPALEHQLHKHFVLRQVNKVNHRKEFFRCDLAMIRQEVESLGLTANWTMTAAAQDYRETLAIEKRIAEDPLAKQRWIERQFVLEDLEDDAGSELVGAAVGDEFEDDVDEQ